LFHKQKSYLFCFFLLFMQPLTQGTNAMENAEDKFLLILYRHVRHLFTTTPLPSHDHNHHLRVWCYAKSLANELSGKKIRITSEEAVNLILAVFFHDTGLTQNLKADHGLDSRILCEQFIRDNPLLFKIDLTPALIAIEKHDNKNYLPEEAENKVSILNLLSLCDDLDAYGAIGILRYAEIYLLRGVSYEKLASLVLANIKSRFDYFASHDWLPAFFFRHHKKRFDFAYHYFLNLSENPESEISIANNQIIKIYIDQVTNGKTGIEGFADIMKNSDNKTMNAFGKVLKAELKSFFINLPE
jgi:HD superfamily phosphodiesterase